MSNYGSLDTTMYEMYVLYFQSYKYFYFSTVVSEDPV